MQDRTIHITSGTIIKTLFILIGFYLIYQLSNIALAIVFSLIIAAAIEPGNKFLMNLKFPFVKWRIPRVVAVIIMFAFIFAVFAGFVTFFLPAFIEDTKQLVMSLPQYVTTIDDWSASLLGESSSFSLTDYLTNIRDEFNTSSLLTTLSRLFGGSVTFILTFVLSFYFSTQEDGITRFIETVSPSAHKKYIVDLWHRSQCKIGLWLQGQLLLGVIIGVLTFLLLFMVGVKSAMFLAVVAGICELIPVFGLFISLILALAVGYTEGGLTLALIIAGIFLLVSQFETHLLYPLVVQKVLGIPPVLVIISLFVGFQLWGFVGVVLSAPVSAVILEMLSDRQKLKKG